MWLRKLLSWPWTRFVIIYNFFYKIRRVTRRAIIEQTLQTILRTRYSSTEELFNHKKSRRWKATAQSLWFILQTAFFFHQEKIAKFRKSRFNWETWKSFNDMRWFEIIFRSPCAKISQLSRSLSFNVYAKSYVTRLFAIDLFAVGGFFLPFYSHALQLESSAGVGWTFRFS